MRDRVTTTARGAAAFLPAAAVLFAMLAPAAVFCAPPRYDVERLSLEEGVSHNLVFDIEQDRTGFIWFGTMYGLVRYDGHGYRFYRHDPDDPHSLSNDDIVTILVDANDDLWLGTYGGGVNHFDRASGTFVRYLPDPDDSYALADGIIWDLAHDRDGAIWVGTESGGLSRIDPAARTVRTWRADENAPGALPHDHVGALTFDDDGRLFVGTTAGLCTYDPVADAFTPVTSVAGLEPDILALGVQALTTGPDGTIWTGTFGGGVVGLDPDLALRAHYRHDPEDEASLPFDWITTIDIVDGRVWAGTFRGIGALREDGAVRENGAFDRYTHVPGDENSLQANYVVAIEQDRSGVVWVGSYQGGAHKLRPRQSVVRHVRGVPGGAPGGGDEPAAIRLVTSFRETRAGDVAIGMKDGLLFWNPRNDAIRRVDRTKLPAPHVRALETDRDGRLLVGTSAGLAAANRDGEFTIDAVYQHDPDDETSLPGNQINALLEDRAGVLWIGTAGGLARRDPAAGTDGSFDTYVHDPDDARSLAGNYVLSLFEDSRERLWVATYQGLSRFDAAREEFTRFPANPADATSLSSNYVFSAHEDERGRIWFGTGNGLNLFVEETGAFRHFREDAGLPNNVIAGIAPSSRGRLWLGTNRGLAEFDPETESIIRTLDASQGAQSNLFTEGACATLANGDVLFGGVNGFNVFDPDSIVSRNQPPEIAITSFWNQGADQRPRDVTSPGDIRLPHDENRISIGFTAFDYHAPERTRFEYRLIGVDETWTRAGADRRAIYTNLAPGDYTFEVRAQTADGVWSRDPARLAISIAPPFWRTAWFALLVLAALAGTLLLIHTVRLRRRLALARAIHEAREEEAEIVRKKAAADFHDELGHRLAKIALFSEVIKNRMANSPGEIRDYLQKIIRESHTLSNDTRDFIWSLGSEGRTLRDLAAYLRDFGNELFDRTDITFRFEGWDEDLDRIQLPIDVRRHTTAIFKEGMTNALKHASCSEVTLRIRVVADLYEISLRDDGVGYSREYEEDGNGLKNMENRARKIQGEIQFASEPGSGSKIQLVRRSE